MTERAVLIVEDEEPVCDLLQTMLQQHCSTVDTASDGEAAIARLQSKRYDVLVLDLMLPKINGLAVAEAAQALPDPPKIIVLSAIARYFGDRLPEGAVELQKPFEYDRFEEALRQVGVK